jgi:hypothetical protein
MVDNPHTGTMEVVGKRAAVSPSLYIFVLIAVLVGTYVFKLRTQGIFACPASGYSAEGYLGYCNAAAYGEYDHGAFWFGLEPEAQRAAAAADVLFIGNSRMECGFSAAATDQWFSSLGLRHYLLGFTFLENSTFAAPLLARLKPHAKVYVINVDQFFTDTETKPGAALIHGGDSSERYGEKRAWQRLHRPLCTALPVLCGNRISFFRFRDNGHWQARGFVTDKPDVVADAAASDQQEWSRDAEIAKQFLSQLPVDRSCVILTVVPSPTTRRAEAQAIAAAVALPLVAPEVSGLRTFDDTHLDTDSAERWSSAFLQAAGPQIRQCVSASGRAAP